MKSRERNLHDEEVGGVLLECQMSESLVPLSQSRSLVMISAAFSEQH